MLQVAVHRPAEIEEQAPGDPFFSAVAATKWSRGASFHAAVEKPSMASAQPLRSWTA